MHGAERAAGILIRVLFYEFKVQGSVKLQRRQFTLFEAVEMAAAAGADSLELFPGQKIGGPHGNAKVSPNLAEVAQCVRYLRAYSNIHS